MPGQRHAGNTDSRATDGESSFEIARSRFVPLGFGETTDAVIDGYQGSSPLGARGRF